MQLGDHPGVVLTQGPTAVDQSTRSTASCSLSTTGRRPAIRVPANATECASVASVLRPWPVAKTRARADSFGGTSITCSPAGQPGPLRGAGLGPGTRGWQSCCTRSNRNTLSRDRSEC